MSIKIEIAYKNLQSMNELREKIAYDLIVKRDAVSELLDNLEEINEAIQAGQRTIIKLLNEKD